MTSNLSEFPYKSSIFDPKKESAYPKIVQI